MDPTTERIQPTPVHDGDTLVDERPTPHDDGRDSPAIAPAPTRDPLTPTETRWLFGILGLSAVLRFAWLAYAKSEPPVRWDLSGDQYSYWYYGNEIAAGRGYIHYITHTATAYYPIGYPAILAGIFWLALHTPITNDLMLVAGIFHAVISVATVWLTFVVARRLFGVRAGLVAAAVLAVFPNVIYQVTSLQLETTFMFLSIAALAVIVDHDWASGPPSRNRLIAFGLVLSISALVRPFSVPLLLGLFLAMLAINTGWKRAAAAVAVPLLVLVLVFIPWTIRNAVRLDAFIPSSTNMGDTLCLDRNMDAYGGFRWAAHDGCVPYDTPEVERNRGNTRKAIEFVTHHPGRELLQITRRARFIFAEDHDGVQAAETMGSGAFMSSSTRHFFNTTADAYFRVMLFLSIAGLPLLALATPRPERRLVITLFATLLIVPLLLWGNPRFHLPLAPFMAITVGGLLTFLADQVAQWWRSGRDAAQRSELIEPA